MCRHIYDWNIVNCDVKQPIQLNSKLNRTELNETLQEARSQCPQPSLCFSNWSEKQNGRPGLWLADTFSTSPLKPLMGIQWNLTGSKISLSSTKFVFFGPIGKTRWPTWPLIGWDIFDFSSETAEQNSKKLYGKQDLNVLYKVCIFRGHRKNKMATLASDLLRHFQLLLWNRWTEVKWKQDLNTLYLVCVFPADWKNKMASPVSHWVRLFDFSSETTERNSGSKISTSSSKLAFFWPISKQKWPPWLIRQKR